MRTALTQNVLVMFVNVAIIALAIQADVVATVKNKREAKSLSFYLSYFITFLYSDQVLPDVAFKIKLTSAFCSVT